MKPPIPYTFVASTKTVTLTGVTVSLDRLLGIVNTTRGIVYYKAGVPSLVATVSGSDIVLNATVSTSGHADSDKLFVVYEDGSEGAKELGGNLAAISTATGAQADAVWTTGNGSVIGLLKAIATKILGTVGVTGPATDTQIRATPIPVSGTVSTGLSQPLTDTQLRATAIPVSVSALPLPSNAATDGTDITTPTAMPSGGAGIRGWLSAIWTKINGSIAVTVASLPLPSGAATEGGNLSTIATNLALGQKTGTASLPVVLASDIPLAVAGTTQTDALLEAILQTLKRIEMPISQDAATGAQRMVAVSGTITTVAAVTTAVVSNAVAIGGTPAAAIPLDVSSTLWVEAVRSRIS